jgi:L-threonylcarbamoyladenylate synthase
MFSTDIKAAAVVIQSGGVAIFPTDTVWGMGCSVESEQGIKKFYEIKQRERNKPTAVLVGSVDQAQRYGILNPLALSLAKVHWPGALTIVVEAKPNVPESIMGEMKTIGLRFPDFELVKELTQVLDCGLVTGSANFSGKPSPFSKTQIDPELLKLVDIVLDGECGNQPPSTVVDCTGSELNILRQGSVRL